MTLPSSKPQPESRSEALASFVDDLRTLGIEVGVDDAFKIGVVFRHAEGWSHGRRVRALVALLGRTEEQRRRIEELESLLFPDAVREPEEKPKSPAFDPSPNRVQSGSRRPARTPVQAGGTTALRKASRPRWKKISDWIAALVMVAAAGWFLYDYLSKPKKSPVVEPSPPIVTPPPATNPTPPGVDDPTSQPPEPAATEPPSNLPPEGLPLPWQTADDLAVDCDVLPVPLPPFWPFFCAFALLALWHVFYGWQRASAGWLKERTEIGQRALKASTGRRSYQVRLADPAEPLDSEPLREAAFALAAPRTESTEARLDPLGTVETTARAAGRLVLHLTREKEQGTVLLLEDVRSPMERWPDHGQQLARTLERQGARLVRRFFQGSPEQLSEHRELRHPARLDEALADLEPELILVVTSASWFDVAKEGERLRAVRLLRDALWLHPRPRELWDGGARWLASRVRIQPLGEPEHLLRGLLAVSTEALPFRWWPPAAVIRSAEAEVSVLRYSLGEAFHWLAAGALLAEHDALTARAWWALRAGFQSRGLLAVPVDLAERVWEPRWVHIGSSGVVTMEKEHREELVRLLSSEQPKLRDQVLEWLESWIQQDVDRLEAAGERPEQPSLGWLLAKLALARARSESSKHATRALADRELGQLTHGGFGAWVNAAVPRTDTTGWRLRRFIPPAPLPWQRRLTVAAVVAQLLLLPLLASSELRRELFPAEPSIQFLTKRETPLLSPNYPLRLCDQYQSLRDFTARIGETEARVVEGRDSRGAVVWEVEPAPAALVAFYSDALRLKRGAVLKLDRLADDNPASVMLNSIALVRPALDDRMEQLPIRLAGRQPADSGAGPNLLLTFSGLSPQWLEDSRTWLIALSEPEGSLRVEQWDRKARTEGLLGDHGADSRSEKGLSRINLAALRILGFHQGASGSDSLVAVFQEDRISPNLHAFVLILGGTGSGAFGIARLEDLKPVDPEPQVQVAEGPLPPDATPPGAESAAVQISSSDLRLDAESPTEAEASSENALEKGGADSRETQAAGLSPTTGTESIQPPPQPMAPSLEQGSARETASTEAGAEVPRPSEAQPLGVGAATLPAATRWRYYDTRVKTWKENRGSQVLVSRLPLGINAEVRKADGSSSQPLPLEDYNDASKRRAARWAMGEELGLYLRGVPDQAGISYLAVTIKDGKSKAVESRLLLEVQDWEPVRARLQRATVGEPLSWNPQESFPEGTRPPPGLEWRSGQAGLSGTPQEAGETVFTSIGRWGTLSRDGSIVGAPRNAYQDPQDFLLRIRPAGCNGPTQDYCGGQCVDTATDPFHWGECFKIHPDLTREDAAITNDAPRDSDLIRLGAARAEPQSASWAVYERLYYKWSDDRNYVEVWAVTDEWDRTKDILKAGTKIPRRVEERGPLAAIAEVASVCGREGELFGLRTQDRAAFAWEVGAKSWVMLPRRDWDLSSRFDNSFSLDPWIRGLTQGQRRCRPSN